MESENLWKELIDSIIPWDTDKEITLLETDIQTQNTKKSILKKLGKSFKRLLWIESKEEKEAHTEYEGFRKEIIQNNQGETKIYSWKTIATLQFLSDEYLEDMIVEINKWKKLNKTKDQIKNEKKYQTLYTQFKESLRISSKNEDEINQLINSFEEYFFNYTGNHTWLSSQESESLNNTVSNGNAQELDAQAQRELAQQQEAHPEIVDKKIHKYFSSITSAPYEKNPNTWVTLCSKTAWQNCCNFWINAPRWNASDSFLKTPSDKNFLANWKNTGKRTISNFNQYNWNTNFADLHITSSSNYWHRAVAFLNTTDKQRYVLDPYRNHKNAKPIMLSEYQKNGAKIIEANFYDSPYKVV